VPDLIARIGGEAFLPTPGSPDLDVSWEEVMEFNPELVMISLCPPVAGLDFPPEAWLDIEGWNRVDAAVRGLIFGGGDCLFARGDEGLIKDARLLQDLLGEAFWGWPPCADVRVRRLKGPR
jgi:hypothetical protein